MTGPRTILERHRAVFADLDGVVYRGPGALPGVSSTLAIAREQGHPIVFVTNNASRTPETVAGHLTEIGVPASPNEVLTAAQAGVALMQKSVARGSRVLVVGGDGLRTAVSQAGYEIVSHADDAPVAVIQGFDPSVSWRELAQASYAVNDGAAFFATNLDRTIPNERGTAPGNGSLVAAVVAATGVTPPGGGKPEAAMFHAAAELAGESDAVMVGDRLDTDIAGANAAGYATLAVLTGVATPTSIVEATGHHRPTYIGADLNVLAEPYGEPVEKDGWWVLEQGDQTVAARVHNAILEIDASDDADLAAITRVACAAAWPHIDAGDGVSLEVLSARE